MKIFEVTRWGNDTGDDFNSKDTNYLVFANGPKEAADLVRTRERNPELDPHIFELGTCTGEVPEPVIFRGPYLENKFMNGGLFTSWAWNAQLEAWVAEPRCTEGEATAHYGNGQLAARVCYGKGKKRVLPNGVFERWYADGQLMAREEYHWGKLVGPKESWYKDGTLAQREEWLPNGKRFQRWDRNGQLISDEFE